MTKPLPTAIPRAGRRLGVVLVPMNAVRSAKAVAGTSSRPKRHRTHDNVGFRITESYHRRHCDGPRPGNKGHKEHKATKVVFVIFVLCVVLVVSPSAVAAPGIIGGMDFRPTDEQEILRRTVREFAEAEMRPHVMEWDEAQHFPM